MLAHNPTIATTIFLRHIQFNLVILRLDVQYVYSVATDYFLLLFTILLLNAMCLHNY